MLCSVCESDSISLINQSFVLGNTTYAVTWMYFIEPYLWTTNYFVTHRYTLTWFIFNVLVYGLIFDSWFYWTHRALHESQYLWDKIHTTHHGFKNPSAFCQDAVHPLEGLVQGMTNVSCFQWNSFSFRKGPMGHYLTALIMPVHPIALAFFGLFTSCYASKSQKHLFYFFGICSLVAAHDGRLGDFNHHYAHHNKGNHCIDLPIRRDEREMIYCCCC